MSGATGAKLAVGLALTLALAGCEEGALGERPEATASGETTTRVVDVTERDVERPDVFAADETGLWDGRPSLGGVWVAHPDVQDPERVIIRNAANNAEVIGALFRRERDNPGPRLQVSSDAATALSIIAGQPTPLEVVVLRREREEIVEEVPVEEETVVAEAEEAATEPAAPAATAAAAADPISSEPLEPILGERDETLEPITAAEAALDAIERDRSRAAGAAAAPVAAAERAAPKTSAEQITAALGLSRQTAAAEAEARAERPSPLEKPFIQVGIFSAVDNAERAGAQLRDAGVVPTILEQSSGDNKFWRIVVGPAQNRSIRRVLLEKIRAVGYSDAYFVTN